MPDPQRSITGLKRMVEAVASASDLTVAVDRLINELADALQTRGGVFDHREDDWRLLAQSREGIGVSPAGLRRVLDNVPTGRPVASLASGVAGESPWTWMALDLPDAPAGVLLAGDWTELKVLEALGLLLSLALRSVHDRDVRRRAERLAIESYGMSRRLTGLVALDVVCQKIVERVSRSLLADRVSLALYRAEEDRLAIVASHGPFPAAFKDLRIEPGAWVIGHVYASGRPVVLPDVRQVPGMPREGSQYRTFSFAAVPVMVGGETIGVLSATDKTDGSAFGKPDELALRSFSTSAALAIKAATNESEARRLAHAATVDALTGLFNRPYLDGRLRQEVERARRGSSSLTLALADIDDFKTINDTYGHQGGDAVLRAVSAIIRSAVRVFDVCARYGGDEFAILMPSSDQSSAAACAERIRRRIAEHEAPDEGAFRLPRLTVSVGVAAILPGDEPADLVRRADRCLYSAKAEGKNAVRLSAELTSAHHLPFVKRSPSERS